MSELQFVKPNESPALKAQQAAAEKRDDDRAKRHGPEFYSVWKRARDKQTNAIAASKDRDLDEQAEADAIIAERRRDASIARKVAGAESRVSG